MFRPTTAFGQKAKQTLSQFTTTTPLNTSTNLVSTKNQRHGFFQFFQNALYPRTGRSWSVHELRIKSPQDLEKLWFVLLKERNSLATYRQYCQQNKSPMRGLERIAKCKASMKAILHVVGERRHTYKELTHNTSFLKERALKRKEQILDNFEARHAVSKKIGPNQHDQVQIQSKKWRRKTSGKGFELRQLYQQAQSV